MFIIRRNRGITYRSRFRVTSLGILWITPTFILAVGRYALSWK